MIKLLLLTCGTNACYHFAKVIKEKFSKDFYIVGADINEDYLIGTKEYLDCFYKVPYSSNPDYYKIVIEILEKENIDFILPSFDDDQALFYPENDDLKALNVKSLGTCVDTLKFYENKIKMYEKMESLNISVPKRYSINGIKDLDNTKEYFLKPINGVGSIGVKILLGEEIKSIINAEDYLIQELCKQPEITLECFHCSGKISTVARQRIETKAGVCTKAKVFKSQKLENIAFEFAQKIKTPMFFNLQFMKNNQSEYVITDVNFRLAGGMGLSYVAGWDEVSAIAKFMLKKDDIFSTLDLENKVQYVLRTYSDIVTKSCKNIVAFDFDGTLLDSSLRHKIVLTDVLKEFNLDVDTTDLIEFKKQGYNNIDFLISKGVSEEIAKKVQNRWIEDIEKDEYMQLDILYPNATELINEYNKDNSLILITARNNKHATLNQIKKFSLDRYFDEICIVPTGKKSAEEKETILSKKNVLLMIGDTETDYNAAKMSKTDFRFVDWGFRSLDYINNYKLKE